LDRHRAGRRLSLQAGFLTSRPYVLINVAASVDGKIDTVERRGAAISSAADRERVDALRAGVDAVMVGGRTLLEEDPRLTVKSAALRAERVSRGESEQPTKVGVLSRPELLRPNARFLTDGPARITLFCPESGGCTQPGVELFRMGNRRVDLTAAMHKLAELGIHRVLVEGGGTLNFELLRLGLVDEVQVFIAPTIFGGASAPTLADGPGGLALRLSRADVQTWPDGGVLLRYMVLQS
jgi:riboflavin-specific deaminase-like protein